MVGLIVGRRVMDNDNNLKLNAFKEGNDGDELLELEMMEERWDYN